MGDDSKKRRQGRSDELPATEEVAAGAFFRAPTRAFQALPTEVLHLGTGSDESERPVAKRAAKQPPELATPPATVALAPWELESIHSEPSGEEAERTSPEPFRVELAHNSTERALYAVAREATHPDIVLDDGDGAEESVTSTETERRAPRPITGVHPPEAGPFDEGTLALEAQEQPAQGAPRFDLEITDEDASLLREVETSPEGEPSSGPEGFLGEPTDAGQDAAYLDEVRAFDFARVYEPGTAVRTDAAGFERQERSDEWPEITLDKLPRLPPKAAPSRRRWVLPAVLLAIFALALAATGGTLYLLEKSKAKASDEASAPER